MKKEKYYQSYFNCYNAILDITGLIMNFFNVNIYTINEVSYENDANYNLKIIKDHLNNYSFNSLVSEEFIKILNVFYPKNQREINKLYDSLEYEVNYKLRKTLFWLKNRYLPFLKAYWIDHLNTHNNYSNKESKWEEILSNNENIELLRDEINEILMMCMNIESDERIDNIIKIDKNISTSELEKYISGGVALDNVEKNEKEMNTKDKVIENVNFKKFDYFFNSIIGQDEAIDGIYKVLKENITFFNAENIDGSTSEEQKPLATFMFYGPTGTGKTETAKIITKFLFNDKKKLLMLDMNCYKDSKTAASSIKGHPEGYVDSDNGTDFIRFLKANDRGVILLDEFEKAPIDVREIFMTMLDEGYFKDALGNVYDLSKYVFIATTNASDQYERENRKIGFVKYDDNEKEKDTQDFLREVFGSPILSRFNKVIHFKSIKYDDAKKIANNIIKNICLDFQRKKFNDVIPKISIDNLDEILVKILKDSNFEKEGVRCLKNTIRDTISNQIINLISEGKKDILITYREGKVLVESPKKNLSARC